MEKIGYALLAIVAIVWLVAMITGMIVAFPFGLLGLIALLGVGILFIKVLKDRMTSKEDDHYSRHVDR